MAAFLKIENVGVCPPEGFAVLGVSLADTTDQHGVIGQFGSSRGPTAHVFRRHTGFSLRNENLVGTPPFPPGAPMPLHVTVGFSKKVGQPDYGSLGASCEVAFEAAGDLLARDPAAFQQQVQFAYAACSLAVSEELTRQRTTPVGKVIPPRTSNGHGVQAPATATTPAPSNGRSGTPHDHDSAPPATGPRASEKQLAFARRLAGQVTGLGPRGLDDLTQRMFAHPLADLSGLEASGLIDVLKELKAGKLQLGHILEGSPA